MSGIKDRSPIIQKAKKLSFKNLLRLKKTTPSEETTTTTTMNVPCKTWSQGKEDDETWGCLHLDTIECIVRHASREQPAVEFRKFLHTASRLNKHWKEAMDDVVDRLDLKKIWQKPLETLLTRFHRTSRLRLTSIDADALGAVAQYPRIKDVELHTMDFASLRMVKALSKFTSLVRLTFRNSPSIQNRAIRALSHCSDLTSLDLTGCSLITGEGAEAIGQITSLVHLSLADCSAISAEGLLALSSLTGLQTLNLSGVHNVGNSVLHSFCSMKNLKDLDVFMCPNVTDIGLWSLAKKIQLHSLNLFSCDKITDEGLKAIAHHSGLRKLNIGWCCLITDKGIRSLCDLAHLHELRLSWVSMSFDGLLSLSKLTSLNLLDVRGCEIGPSKLNQGIKALRSISGDRLTVLRS